jgi:hypothetical protein
MLYDMTSKILYVASLHLIKYNCEIFSICISLPVMDLQP